MKLWITKATDLLRASLGPPGTELNEIDWKSGISPDKHRLTEHLSAFANHGGGGFLTFGVTSDGHLKGIDEAEANKISHQLANLGRNALEPLLQIDHAVVTFRGSPLLFVSIPESDTKPVHLRGKSIEASFIRSGGTTRLASRQELGALMLNSRTPVWEGLSATGLVPDADLLGKLDGESIVEMLHGQRPSTHEGWMSWLEGEHFIIRSPNGGGQITNLGAIAAARSLSDFESISRKAIRVVRYKGRGKTSAIVETEGKLGYAVGFSGLIRYIQMVLPTSEILVSGIRKTRSVYPEIALREIIANALIHQDFTVTGAGPLIEIYDDRVEIGNPGQILPSKTLDRLIGTQPESRNERLAKAFRRYGICEERGSGLIKAIQAVELHELPPIEFRSEQNFFKATIFAPRTFSQMTPKERLEACYQHAVLKYVTGGVLTNKSLRERLGMPEKQRSMVSLLIQQAIKAKKIKAADPDNESRKFMEYLPYWA